MSISSSRTTTYKVQVPFVPDTFFADTFFAPEELRTAGRQRRERHHLRSL